ncbi:hypothetical protein QYF61_007027 [Mycteria americana]|uniref:G-protein coupled receptors family 1 profile domain-containing protein n=1 Tax=Mycteria americana TaxID=33587 RepID=A0AAN7N154_MYCAM|nr:hypothetical protein QYF61_007027 [Mycteria americana]
MGSKKSASCLNLSMSSPLSTDKHIQRQQMSNGSSIAEFLLLAFADTRQLQLLHFWLFLGIYLAALLGNGLIITAVACDHRLHTPMYFFLLNLSVLDLGSISTTVPKSMGNSLWDTRAISYAGCASQIFFFFFCATAEFYLLTIMAYDRYVAICKPLHYGTLLGSRACVHMAAAAWGSGFLNSLLHTANTFSIPLCQGNALDQFFCEIPQILKLSCLDSDYLREAEILVVSALFAFVCFVFIVLSYVQIFRAVMRIPSEQGWHKAFSTCLPHLALFISTSLFAYLKPPSISSPSLDLVVAVLYSVVPPAVNPLIYSLRNQELKDALHHPECPLTGDSTISAHSNVSANSCTFACTECFLLVGTSYNQYLAVRHPLLSARLMNWKGCVQETAAPWLGGLLSSTVIIWFLSQIHFVAPMYWTTCSLPLPVHAGILCVHQSCHPGAALLPSVGRQKTFSTCSAHLTSVTFFYIIHRPCLCDAQNTPPEIVCQSPFSTPSSPLLNPVTYSWMTRKLRGRGSLRKTLRKAVSCTESPLEWWACRKKSVLVLF